MHVDFSEEPSDDTDKLIDQLHSDEALTIAGMVKAGTKATAVTKRIIRVTVRSATLYAVSVKCRSICLTSFVKRPMIRPTGVVSRKRI